jgi:hypothetical protein
MARLEPWDMPFSWDLSINELEVPIANGIPPGRYKITSPNENVGAL